MTQDDIIRMARQAGAHDDGFEVRFKEPRYLERFAALVIKPWADQLEVERKRFQELNDIVALGMQHARADEREACAKMVDHILKERGGTWGDAIRARGTRPTTVIYSPGQLAERGLTHEDVVKLIKENT